MKLSLRGCLHDHGAPGACDDERIPLHAHGELVMQGNSAPLTLCREAPARARELIGSRGREPSKFIAREHEEACIVLAPPLGPLLQLASVQGAPPDRPARTKVGEGAFHVSAPQRDVSTPVAGCNRN